jgi:hypothetical protein
MAAKGSKDQNEIQRSDPIDVTEPNQAAALLAAWRGVHEFFGGQVSNWNINPPDEGNPDGSISATGFSVRTDRVPDVNTLLADLSKRDRRVSFLPAYLYVTGMAEPAPFEDAQDMTNFMVGFLKGSVEEGTSKTPEYVRNAVAQYKAEKGLATRRGPKRRIIRLDALDELDANALQNIDPAALQKLLALAAKVAGTPASGSTEEEPVEVVAS